MLEVYLDPCTINCRKVLAGLDLIGTEYDLKFVDYFKGEQKADWFTKINPHATVPAAVDEDLVLTESNAILAYAADSNGKAGSIYPSDLKKRAKVNTWLLWESSAWFASCYVYLVENVVKPLMDSKPDQSVLDDQAPRWNQLAQILEDQLAKTKYLTGKDITIADIAVASPFHLPTESGFPTENYPNLMRWMAEIEKLPCWQKTQGAVEKALLPNKQQKAKGAMNGNGNTIGNTNGNGASSKETSVPATLNYSKETDKLTELYFYEHPEAEAAHAPGDDPFEVSIHDGWDKVDSFSIDKNGFAVKDFHTDFERWEDEKAVASSFYDEVVDFIKRETGAKRVLVFDHTIRTKANQTKKLTQESGTTQRAPVLLVHCDYTAESGPIRVKQLLKDEADDLLSRRVAFINVWKPIHRTVAEAPLAMCDFTSSPMDDFFKLHLRYRDRNGENYVMKRSDKHKWWYFPNMTPEKVILLKTYESETDRAQFVGHSAFTDPTSPPDAPARESVEIRTIAFF